MSEFEVFPGGGQFQDVPYAELAAPNIGKSAAHVPASYDRQVREVLAQHTGSSETYLSPKQEQELATSIQDGHAARAERESLEAQIATQSATSPRLKNAYSKVLSREREGRRAEHTLVECSLRFSAYLAKASMNILPAGDEEAPVGSRAHIRRQALRNSQGVPWLPADFTSLRSRHAVLDDRIQVANIGLIKAARIFAPGRIGKKGHLVTFATHAAPIIKTEILRYVRGGRPDDHEKPIHIPSDVISKIFRARSDEWHELFTPEERERLLGYERLQDTIPLHQLYFAGTADEEVGRESDDPSLLLEVSDVIPDEENEGPLYDFLDAQLSDRIEELLGTLSDREADVIRLRYGFNEDGKQYMLDEIGQVYGLTRERIRQILKVALGELRAPSRSSQLVEFLDMEEGGQLPVRSGDVIKTRQTIGRSLIQLAASTEPEVRQSGRGDESWQAYPGESWEEPVRKSEARLEAEYITTGRRLKELIFGASLYTFQRSFAEDMKSPYPKVLVEHITKTLGRELTPDHIADFWNDNLESFLQHIADRLEGDASPDRATQLLSRLLAERMGDSDVVELRIPERLRGKLGYVGAWLSHGKIRVLGDVCDNAGYEMDSLGHLQIEGSVGHFAGNCMKGNARLEIDGNTGNFLGFAMKGHASILVNGNTGSYCGHRMNSRGATIEVLGAAGESLGYQMLNGEITVGDKRFTKE